MELLGMPVIEWSADCSAYWREAQERRAAALAEEAHLLTLDCVGLSSFARLCEVEEARILLDAEMERPPPTLMVDMGGADFSVLSVWDRLARSNSVVVGLPRHCGKTATMEAVRDWLARHNEAPDA